MTSTTYVADIFCQEQKKSTNLAVVSIVPDLISLITAETSPTNS